MDSLENDLASKHDDLDIFEAKPHTFKRSIQTLNPPRRPLEGGGSPTAVVVRATITSGAGNLRRVGVQLINRSENRAEIARCTASGAWAAGPAQGGRRGSAAAEPRLDARTAPHRTRANALHAPAATRPPAAPPRPPPIAGEFRQRLDMFTCEPNRPF
ncbi:hypothetical protein EVAR_5426_1 [Eumeta japonica]|uniref:Uncharacterized protein n=1 Tax=Eumeta variegata TaxID=151549 RepID=A0A4C1T9J0_EUMVA|nr:hypothetical protein EVAR_5426_1 [Eumeta japonica]